MNETLSRCARYAIFFFSPDRRFRLAEEVCGSRPRYVPGDMLGRVREKDGFGNMLLADLVLFGWCFLVALAIDLFLPAHVLVKNLIGVLCCTAAFGLGGDNAKRAVLKACFLGFALLDNMSRTLAASCMLLFEHLSNEAFWETR